MKSKFVSGFIAVALSVAMVCTSGCNTPTWTEDAQAGIPLASSAITSVITVVELLSGKTITSAQQSEIASATQEAQADLATVTTLITQYTAAPSASITAKITAALTDAQNNLGGLLTSLHISDPATQAKVGELITLAVGLVGDVAAIVPLFNGGTPAAATAMGLPYDGPRLELSRWSLTALPALPAKSPAAQHVKNVKKFKKAFNAALAKPSGNPVVDAACAKAKLK